MLLILEDKNNILYAERQQKYKNAKENAFFFIASQMKTVSIEKL